MIIFGSIFIAIGVAALAGVSLWPSVLIGLGAGMVLSGLSRSWDTLGLSIGGRLPGQKRRRSQGSQTPLARHEPS